MTSCRSVATTIRAYLFAAASERVVARLKRNLFSQLISQVKHHLLDEASQIQVVVSGIPKKSIFRQSMVF